MELAERMLRYRAKKNLTQADLAKVLGTSQTAIHRAESGKPKMRKVRKIMFENKMDELEEK